MTGTLRPRANAFQPVRGRACGSAGAPVRNPRRRVMKPPRCAVHARRHPRGRCIAGGLRCAPAA